MTLIAFDAHLGRKDVGTVYRLHNLTLLHTYSMPYLGITLRFTYIIYYKRIYFRIEHGFVKFEKKNS